MSKTFRHRFTASTVALGVAATALIAAPGIASAQDAQPGTTDDAQPGTTDDAQPGTTDDAQPGTTDDAPTTPATPPVTEPVEPVEPVVTEPVVEQPVTPAQPPVVEQPPVDANPVPPVAEQPVVEQPVVEQPVVEQPVVEQPAAETPVAEAPVAQAPVAQDPVIPEVSTEPAPVVLSQYTATAHLGGDHVSLSNTTVPYRTSFTATGQINGVEVTTPEVTFGEITADHVEVGVGELTDDGLTSVAVPDQLAPVVSGGVQVHEQAAQLPSNPVFEQGEVSLGDDTAGVNASWDTPVAHTDVEADVEAQV